jgi:hypothetical protein
MTRSHTTQDTPDIHRLLAEEVERVLSAVMPNAVWRRGNTEWRCGGPHGAAGSSFCVYVGASPKRGRYRDFSGDPTGRTRSMIDLIQLVEGGDAASAFRRAREILGLSCEPVDDAERHRRDQARADARVAAEERERRSRLDATKQQDKIAGIWRGVRALSGTPGEAYFRDIRCITPPLPCRFAVLPYWTEARKTEQEADPPPLHLGDFPCVVTPVLSDDAGRPVLTALHLTYLDLDRPKGKLELVHPQTGEVLPAKKFRGSPGAGWIRLTPAREVMVVAEGIENTQSVLDLRPGWGGWCPGSSGRFSVLRFPSITRRVVGIGEGDSAPARGPGGAVIRHPDGTPVIPADQSLRLAARDWAEAGKRRVDLTWVDGDPNALVMAGRRSVPSARPDLCSGAPDL